MKSRRGSARTFVAICLCAWLGVALCAEIKLGRDIFEIGTGREGRQIGAQLGGADGVRMQGAAVACAACHGRDGRGGAEGWVHAPDLRWFALNRAHGKRRADGSIRPAYDRKALSRAVRAGVAPDGIVLDTVMPRYDLADDEIDALLLHLRELDQAPPASPPALVVLMPQQASGPAARLLQGMQQCPPSSQSVHLPALTVVRYDDIPEALARLQALEQAGGIAAVFAPYLVSMEAEYARAAFHDQLPTLLPIALADIDPPGEDIIMFQLPSLKAQAHALLLAPTVDDAASLAIYRHVGEGASEQTLRHLDNVAAGRSWPASRVGSIDDLQVDTSIVLALAPLPAPPVNRDVAGVQLLVPALFMDSAAAEAWRARGATVRVSFPYPPQPIASPGQWVGPEQAWIALSCELLGRLPRMPTEAGALGEWREQVGMMQGLHLAGWFDLPARSNFEDQFGRVEVMEWPFD